MAAGVTSADGRPCAIPRLSFRNQRVTRAVLLLRGRYGVGRLAAGALLGELPSDRPRLTAWSRGPGPLTARPTEFDPWPGAAAITNRDPHEVDPGAARNLRLAGPRERGGAPSGTCGESSTAAPPRR
jgi:hypothetical protein